MTRHKISETLNYDRYTPEDILDQIKWAKFYNECAGSASEGLRKANIAEALAYHFKEEDPKIHAEISDACGTSYFHLAKFTKALGEYDNAITSDPQKVDYYRNRIKVYKIKIQQDLSWIKILEKNHPPSTSPRRSDFSIGDNHLHDILEKKESADGLTQIQERRKKLINDCTKAIESGSTNPQFYNVRAWMFGIQGEYEKAIKDLKKYLKAMPNCIGSYHSLGLNYGLLKEDEKAINYFTKAIELDPKRANVYNDRGLSYELIEDLDKALNDYDICLSLNPRSVDCYRNRARVYSKIDKDDEAFGDLEKARKLDQYYYKIHVDYGNLFLKRKVFDFAIAEYGRAIELEPKMPELYQNRINVYEIMIQYDLDRIKELEKEN